MNRFEGKTAIVTGGNKGLGRETVSRLVSEGAEVLVAGRDEEELAQVVSEETANGGKVSSISGDLSDPGFCTTLIREANDRWPKIDVLINNAGVFDEALFLDTQLENWDYVMNVMLRAPYLLAQGAARTMVENGGGSIVHLSSIDGHNVDGPYTSYSVAKAGLMQLSKNIAVELGRDGVRSNTVSPGWALTPMVEAAITDEDELNAMMNDFQRVPLKRMVFPREVASAVCYLASDDASGITGTDLVVDGGTTADLYILPTLGGDETKEEGK